MPPTGNQREEQSKRLRDAVERKSEEARARSEEDSLDSARRPPDVASPRAKSTGHKKKTADKWNQ
jgi:hypothetical protein